jgi:SPP1 gp7 family putative phage head morphogenesis protein
MNAHAHAHANGRARLAELEDPTNTQGLRERFIREFRRRFRRLRGRIREAVGYEDDVLHLAQDARLADADDVERFPTDGGKIRAFIKWLREKLDEDVLEPATRREVRNGEHWSSTYIRAAYVSGWEQARERLQNEGVSTETVEDVFRLGVPQRQLRRLYTRAYEQTETVTSATAPVVRETLTVGLAEGVNPREMARRLTDAVESIERTRANALARTEIINSYSEATLDRYDRAGVEGVTVSGEFATADDDRVCPVCAAIEGAEFATDAMREETFEFDPATDPDAVPSDGGTYPVKPPVHPRCRCAMLPVIE